MSPSETAAVPTPADARSTHQLVLISGLSGSGKSVALTALEDSGYYCVDNLPPQLITPLVEQTRASGQKRVAVAVDARSAESLADVPRLLENLRASCEVHAIYLDCATDTLVQRFSETRRRHPLTSRVTAQQIGNLAAARGEGYANALIESIEIERELLSPVAEIGLHIDTSQMKSAQLRDWIKQTVRVQASQMVVLFESFAFKRGVPLDADYVFDVRMLPNPHYDPVLRPLTGRDAPVAEFLLRQPEVLQMQADISGFLQRWLPKLAADHRSYVGVAIGCTGGQHRSVYLSEQLSRAFASQYTVLLRHRELGATGSSEQ
ncbi:MAG: RNase adapter RapZ [Thiomonas arsenitoxydans]|uniref:RNase adapter RapZ n=1 Tax=Thiomonas arsenitoxydans (strain DSM 22701 / CIP 110005 / 3As) TaxID=426114 RepID=A0A8I1MXK6_THIA3|nr:MULTISPECIES: RNase adapter RapZ [Thiomonas]MBN8744148.1 RNase adapter RapZ [Thiomonas arsenitoxydans]ODU91610.1 MAG: RNase adaptor protein RapZ [Thiomonas sp. SCN 64-16]